MSIFSRRFQPDIPTVKSMLLKKIGEDILIIEAANKPAVVCFRNTGYKIITDTWYANRTSNDEEESLPIVYAAATIILEDLRS